MGDPPSAAREGRVIERSALFMRTRKGCDWQSQVMNDLGFRPDHYTLVHFVRYTLFDLITLRSISLHFGQFPYTSLTSLHFGTLRYTSFDFIVILRTKSNEVQRNGNPQRTTGASSPVPGVQTLGCLGQATHVHVRTAMRCHLGKGGAMAIPPHRRAPANPRHKAPYATQ
jgi:hypothetical protein